MTAKIKTKKKGREAKEFGITFLNRGGGSDGGGGGGDGSGG